jgi:N-acetylmuramoyl-L-alanine amidase
MMRKHQLVLLDPRHGGSSNGIEIAGVREKDVNLAVCLKLKALLEKIGLQVLLTRTGDETVTDEQRILLANQSEADLFVSWSCDTLDDEKVSGVSLWISDQADESSAKGLRSCSREHQLIHFEEVGNRICDESGQMMLGVFQESDAVLDHLQVPAVLVRGAFLSNEKERSQCTDEAFLAAQAKGAAIGIVEALHRFERQAV